MMIDEYIAIFTASEYMGVIIIDLETSDRTGMCSIFNEMR
jgi:hypothetical protein